MAFCVALLALAALAAADIVGTCGDMKTSLTTTGATAGNQILLSQDITCSDTTWTTVATLAGTLDGQGHTVTFTSLTSISGVAFVGTLTGTIKNIRFVGAVMGTGTGLTYVAFLVGIMTSGLIDNVDVLIKPGTYSAGSGRIGGIVGRLSGGDIRSTKVSGGSLGSVIFQGSSRLSGLAGQQSGGTISDCFVFFIVIQGTGTGSSPLYGGFVASHLSGSITRSVVDGVSVKGTGGNLGGFASASGGTISKCAVVDTTNSGAVIQSSAISTGGFLGSGNAVLSDNYVNLPGGMDCGSTVINCGGFVGASSTVSNSFTRISISGASTNKKLFVGSGTVTNCVYSTDASPQTAVADGLSTGLTDAQISAGDQAPMTSWDKTAIWFFPGARLRFTLATDQLAIETAADLGVAATMPTALFASSANIFVGYRLAVVPLTSTTVSGSTTTPFNVQIVDGASTAVSPQPAIATGQCVKVVLDLNVFAATRSTASRTVYGLSGSSWVQVDTFGSSCTAFRRATTLTKNGNTWTFYTNQFTQFAVACDAGMVDTGSGTCVTGSTGGDPHFRGLAGQKYLIGGEPGTVYNIISTPSLLVNALFGATVGPHHMTVMHEIGIVVGTDTVFANKFNRLQLNGVAAPASAVLSDGVSVLTRDINKTGDGITLHTPEFLLRWLPRGYEIDLSEVKLLRPGDASVHGLLGQTWNSAKWPASSLTTEITDAAVLFPALLAGSGESDYAVRDGLFGHECGFSTFDSGAYPEVHAAPAMSKAGRKAK